MGVACSWFKGRSFFLFFIFVLNLYIAVIIENSVKYIFCAKIIMHIKAHTLYKNRKEKKCYRQKFMTLFRKTDDIIHEPTQSST